MPPPLFCTQQALTSGLSLVTFPLTVVGGIMGKNTKVGGWGALGGWAGGAQGGWVGGLEDGRRASGVSE